MLVKYKLCSIILKSIFGVTWCLSTWCLVLYLHMRWKSASVHKQKDFSNIYFLLLWYLNMIIVCVSQNTNYYFAFLHRRHRHLVSHYPYTNLAPFWYLVKSIAETEWQVSLLLSFVISQLEHAYSEWICALCSSELRLEIWEKNRW